MKKLVKIAAIIAIIAISGFAGYEYYADVSAIGDSEVTITDASISEIGITYCKIKLKLEIHNPAGRDISGLSVKFDMYLTANYIGDGHFPEIFISAHSTRIREMTITLYYADLTDAVINMIRMGEFVLTLKGEVEGDVLYGLTKFSQRFEASYSFP